MLHCHFFDARLGKRHPTTWFWCTTWRLSCRNWRHMCSKTKSPTMLQYARLWLIWKSLKSIEHDGFWCSNLIEVYFPFQNQVFFVPVKIGRSALHWSPDGVGGEQAMWRPARPVQGARGAGPEEGGRGAGAEAQAGDGAHLHAPKDARGAGLWLKLWFSLYKFNFFSAYRNWKKTSPKGKWRSCSWSVRNLSKKPSNCWSFPKHRPRIRPRNPNQYTI